MVTAPNAAPAGGGRRCPPWRQAIVATSSVTPGQLENGYAANAQRGAIVPGRGPQHEQSHREKPRPIHPAQQHEQACDPSTGRHGTQSGAAHPEGGTGEAAEEHSESRA
jgi:hypothetical protein